MSLDLARIRRWAPRALGAVFLVSGTLHLVRPQIFLPLVPDALPARDAIVLVSGIGELICAAGLLSGARWAGPASAALLVAVFPGNISFALSAATDASAPRWLVAAAIARLPLQVPLVWAALQARR